MAFFHCILGALCSGKMCGRLKCLFPKYYNQVKNITLQQKRRTANITVIVFVVSIYNSPFCQKRIGHRSNMIHNGDPLLRAARPPAGRAGKTVLQRKRKRSRISSKNRSKSISSGCCSAALHQDTNVSHSFSARFFFILRDLPVVDIWTHRDALGNIQFARYTPNLGMIGL